MEDNLRYIPIMCVLIIYLARMREVGKKRNLIHGEIKEGLTLLLFKLIGLFVVISGVAEFYWLKHPFSLTWLLLGVIVSLSSFYIRSKAIEALGPFWSLHVEIRANHLFVKTGPFQYVRHPAYTSMVLEILAVGIILQTPISTVLALMFFIPVMAKRIQLEEYELIAKFGDQYVEYKKLTPAFIPLKTR